jgi:hypothetical protein
MAIIIKRSAAFIIGLMLSVVFFKTAAGQQKFEKSAFYNVMSSGNVEALDGQLSILESESLHNKQGYEGALLMKKAGMVSPAGKKLQLFKAGRIKLETALKTDSTNTEFHFLRLAIEEHAPKIVKYHYDIEHDKAFVQKNFKSLSPTVQTAILDYCKKSKVLHAEDLQPGTGNGS